MKNWKKDDQIAVIKNGVVQIVSFDDLGQHKENKDCMWDTNNHFYTSKEILANVTQLKRRKTLILANQIAKSWPKKGTALSTTNWRKHCFSTAKEALRLYKGAERILIGLKLDGTKTVRIVIPNWKATHTVNGKGHPVKPGRKLFTDLGKQCAGAKNDTCQFSYGRFVLA